MATSGSAPRWVPRHWRAAVPAGRLQGRTGAIALVAVALTVLVAAPLGALLLALANHAGSIPAALADGGLGSALVGTLVTAIPATALAVTGGTAAALAIEGRTGRAAQGARAVVVLPLLPPPFIVALGVTAAYGRAGLLDQALGVSLPWLVGPIGIVLVEASATLPLAYLVVAAAMRGRADPDAVRAARASGATARTALRTVTLPLLGPAIADAALLVGAVNVNAFGAQAVLGLPAGFTTLTTRLYEDLVFASDDAALTRALVTAAVLMIVVALLGLRALMRSAPGVQRSGLPPGAESRRPLGRPAAILIALWGVIVVGLPLLAVLLTSVTKAVGLPPVPPNLTLDNFAAALGGPSGEALRNSLVLAAGAATAAVALGALLTVTARGRSRWLGAAAGSGFAMPGSALALGVLIAWGPAMRDTLAIILIAYVAKLWAVGHRTVVASLGAMPADVANAARASGAGPAALVRTIMVPALRGPLLAGWLLVFTMAIHELTMSSLLYGPGNTTLAVAVLQLQELGDPTVTAALAVVLTGIVALVVLPLLVGRRGWGTVLGQAR